MAALIVQVSVVHLVWEMSWVSVSQLMQGSSWCVCMSLRSLQDALAHLLGKMAVVTFLNALDLTCLTSAVGHTPTHTQARTGLIII